MATPDLKEIIMNEGDQALGIATRHNQDNLEAAHSNPTQRKKDGF